MKVLVELDDSKFINLDKETQQDEVAAILAPHFGEVLLSVQVVD